MTGSQRAVLFGVLVLSTPALAGAQVIRGTIVDAEAGAPVTDATVELVSSAARAATTSDSAGAFVVTLPHGGRYGLRVRHVGYLSYETDSVHVALGETVRVTIQLGRNVIPLAPLVVNARSEDRLAGFETRRAFGDGRFLTRADIQARGAAATTDLLRGMPGVAIVPVAQRPSKSLIVMQGSLGRCRAAVWVDGVQVEQFPESTPDDVLTPSSIEAVEVYNSFSTAPPQYVSGACGVVVFWTRRGGTEEGSPWRWKRMLAGVGAALLVVLLIR